MDNIKKIISKHNLKIFNEKDNNQNAICNCNDREQCPLNGNCLIDSVIHKATIKKKDANNNNDNNERI